MTSYNYISNSSDWENCLTDAAILKVGLNHWKTGQIVQFLNGIQEPDHLTNDLLLTIWKTDMSGFRIPTVMEIWSTVGAQKLNLIICIQRPNKMAAFLFKMAAVYVGQSQSLEIRPIWYQNVKTFWFWMCLVFMHLDLDPSQNFIWLPDKSIIQTLAVFGGTVMQTKITWRT